MRTPFQPKFGNPLGKPKPAQADALLDTAMSAMRSRIEQRFVDAGLELTDADLRAVMTGVAEAIRAAEVSAVETLIAFKQASAK